MIPVSGSRPVLRGLLLSVAALALLAGGVLACNNAGAAEEARVIPAPQMSLPVAAETETAVLAGGCFWGVQGVFQHVTGVSSAVSGYAGGERSTAQYRLVGSGSTGHAEAVRITYDPKQISYGQILQIYFSVAHDPTQLNRQGPDHGPQYRSAVFPTTPEQAQVAKAYIAQLNQARVFDGAIVTKIEPDREFYPAEAYHQDYATLHPRDPYIAYNDLPKIENLKKVFPKLWRDNPVLVVPVLVGKPGS